MGERRAYYCDHPDHLKTGLGWRQFLRDGPVPPCPEHRNRKLVRQENAPYNAKTDGKVPR